MATKTVQKGTNKYEIDVATSQTKQQATIRKNGVQIGNVTLEKSFDISIDLGDIIESDINNGKFDHM